VESPGRARMAASGPGAKQQSAVLECVNRTLALVQDSRYLNAVEASRNLRRDDLLLGQGSGPAGPADAFICSFCSTMCARSCSYPSSHSVNSSSSAAGPRLKAIHYQIVRHAVQPRQQIGACSLPLRRAFSNRRKTLAVRSPRCPPGPQNEDIAINAIVVLVVTWARAAWSY